MENSANVTHRINEFIQHTGLSMLAFAAKCGVNYSRLAKALSKEADFGISIIQKIIQVYPELNLRWLITGAGNMLIKPQPPEPELHEPVVSYNKTETVDEKLIDTLEELVKVMREKSEEKKGKEMKQAA